MVLHGFPYIMWISFSILGSADDSPPLANEPLNFMVVALNGSWKLNVGYFCINGLNSIKRQELITMCLRKLHERGAITISLTFDGLSVNFCAVNNMGADLYKLPDPQKTFKHPATGDDVAVILDAMHMFKLLRNVLGSNKVIIDDNGNSIKWCYIEELVALQNNLGLHFANKLTDLHLNYYKKSMNVKLAVQVFSKSVANALEYLLKQGHEQFKGCEATIRFIRIMNNLIDILNSRK